MKKAQRETKSRIERAMLLDIDDCVTQTERLLIRSPRHGDGRALNRAVRESRAELSDWMPWAQSAPTLEESEDVCQHGATKFAERTDMMMFIFSRKNGRFLGGTGLHRIDWSIPRFEIGYWMRTSETGKGYTKEAVNGLTEFCFTTLQAERVEIRCDSRNKASAAVAKSCGYTYEGCLRAYDRDMRGDLWNLLLFSKVRSEFQ